MRDLLTVINQILIIIPANGIEEIALMGLINNVKNGFIENGSESEDYYWRRLVDVTTDWCQDTKNYELYNKMTDIIAGVGNEEDVIVIDVVGDLARDLFTQRT